MNRKIAFRAWDKKNKVMINAIFVGLGKVYGMTKTFKPSKELENVILMQYTGLKDKNGLTEIYEGDIIDSEGNIKGNIYENNLDKKETDTIIQGFGTKTWCETYRRAIFLGCKDSE